MKKRALERRAETSETPWAIEIKGLTKRFLGRGGDHTALSDVSFAVGRGRTLAIVGESGAGKTTLIRCVAGLERPSSGQVLVNGRELQLRHGRTGHVQMVFQNPRDALDPMRGIGSSVGEPLRKWSRAERRKRVTTLLSLVGIDPRRAGRRPNEFSGGQLQRIVIARALAPSPSVLLCDEPTSALDVSVQAQILNLLLSVQEQERFAGIVVTHDLAVARTLAEDVLFLRAGRVLFHGSFEQLVDPATELDPYVSGLVRTARESELPVGSVEAGGFRPASDDGAWQEVAS
ncbi:ABC transporter ATP-binding protein [Amycolatopsis sp. GM8]|uniref:ABC transporter ATP-binding protein n=1 Tax=Amycolatopsis sp. GM8 TaxID=2896530 RepID=UPI001F3171A2|nr:dipeptide/oligopeptide/nickel ABC transporter ATP-binding protein [Amycolatopsis sp. GM8]